MNRSEPIVSCPDCGSRHLGRRCGMSFAQRLRTVRLDPSATPTRTMRNNYDREALADQFGEDAREQALDDTNGLGPVLGRDTRGRLLRRDRHTREIVPVTEREFDSVYLRAGEEHEAGEELQGL